MEVCWCLFYWIVAALVSVFWGWQGYVYINYDCATGNDCTESNEECEGCELYGFKEKNQQNIRIGYFVSDFLSSIIGFAALYILLVQDDKLKDFGVFHIFLGVVAIIGITGFGHKFTDVFKKFFKLFNNKAN